MESTECTNQLIIIYKFYRSSTKFIKALLDGSAQEEKDTLAKLRDALGFRSSPVQQFGIPYPVMFPYAQRQTAESGDEMFELMKKFMMKKFLKKFSEDGAADDFFGGEKKRNVSSDFFLKKIEPNPASFCLLSFFSQCKNKYSTNFTKK